MRWATLILVGIFLFSFASAEVECPSSMVAYWQFEGNTYDYFGNYDGSVTSGTVMYDNNIINSAATFYGLDVITINHDEIDGVFGSSFSVEFWMNPTVPMGGSLFKKGDSIDIRIDGSNLVAEVNGVSFSSSISPDTNYLVALTWDSSNRILNFYVNGEDLGQENEFTFVDNGYITLGEGYSGLIDELALYYLPVTEDLMLSHYRDEGYCIDGSGDDVVFDVGGCVFDVPGGVYTVAPGKCASQGYYDYYKGKFYCGDDVKNHYTVPDQAYDSNFDGGIGCAMGNGSYTPDNPNSCCPDGYFCNSTGESGKFLCYPQENTCSIRETEDECLGKTTYDENNCRWLKFTNECVASLGDYACSYYDSWNVSANPEGPYDNEDLSSACEEDELELGTTGVGSEKCGDFFECEGEIFGIHDCGCIWVDGVAPGSRCQHTSTAKQVSYTDGEQTIFNCTSDYRAGGCVNGVQTVEWTSEATLFDGFGVFASSIPDVCVDEFCGDGSIKRYCGEPIVKLPGFSFFALFASLFVLVIYYVRREI